MKRVSPALLLLDHPCLPEVRVTDDGLALVAPPSSDLGRLSRTSRLAVAVQVLALSSLLAELDLWTGQAAIRGLEVIDDGEGPQAVVAGLPRSLGSVHGRLGGGEEAGRRTRDAVLETVRSTTELPAELFERPLEHDWLTLVPWISRLVRLLPQPLDPVTARSLWMVRWKLPTLPLPREVAYWSVPDRRRAMRLACGVWQNLRDRGQRVWLQETSPEEVGTAPQAGLGAGGCLIVAGEHTQGDLMAVSRWIARAGEGRAIVIGTFPSGWSPPEPAVVEGERLDRHLFITGPERDRARAEVGIRRGRFGPFSGADAHELSQVAAALFADGERGKATPVGEDLVGRVLSLLPGGVPEAMAMALTALRPPDLARRAQALGAVRRGDRWRLPLPPLMRTDELHREVAGLFVRSSGPHLRHRLLGGEDEGEALEWVRMQTQALEGREALSVFGEVAPDAVPPALRLALAEAALGELDLTEARRWLAAVSEQEGRPWTRWLNAVDTPPDVKVELVPEAEAAVAPRAAAEVALRRLEGAVLGTAGGAREAEAALRRCIPALGGFVRRRIEINLTLLSENKKGRDRRWRHEVTAGSPVLRRELAHRMALVMFADGRYRAGARILRCVADEEPAPGRAGLVQLDLGRVSLVQGDTVAADLHHLRAFRLLQAAGFRFRTRVVLFNMGVSDLDKLEVNRALARFSTSDDGRPDQYLDWERTRLALAIGDERRFTEGVQRLPPQEQAERDGVGEGTAFLRGAEALLRHDLSAAVELLERGGQEGSMWVPLAKTLLGEDERCDDDVPDPWGLLLCARLAGALVRGDRAAAVAVLGTGSPILASQALALAICERLLGRQDWVAPGVRNRAVSALVGAGLDGWARRLRDEVASSSEVLGVLGRLAEEGSLSALAGDEVGELLEGLGVTGLEVRARRSGHLVWRAGDGIERERVDGGDVSLVALGAPVRDRSVWRLLTALTSLLVVPDDEDPDPEASATGLHGGSNAIRELRGEIKSLASADMPVTILGETGVGKEVAARALHRLSGRRGRFVGVNMAAVPAALVESELFGSVRGAFTGADRERGGLAVAAHHGTLFLDEIGDLDLALQAKLLRFLESHEVRPVGSDRVREVDVRIVAATHRDLSKLVRDGTFRADLFFRIASVTVTIAPLRDRREDIPVLRELFESLLMRRNGSRPLRWSREAEAALLRHDWPGNVRELRSVIEVAAVRADGGVVRPEHLPFDAVPEPIGACNYEVALTGFRRRLFRSALQRHQGNRSATARELGISRQTLLYHIRTLGLTDV